MKHTHIDTSLIIESMIEPQSRVLDLGCGDGSLLSSLIARKRVEGTGVEISHDMVASCLAKGLCVFQADIDKGLSHWEDATFDYVILKSTLEVIHRPYELILEMLRVGRHALVTVSNFGYLANRIHTLLTGRMTPRIRAFSPWYETSVIRYVCMDEFFEALRRSGVRISEARYVTPFGSVSRKKPLFANLFVVEAVFLLTRTP
ncbi:MAG TPA: methionine biosynthesis protein MetW [Deltaproteobacteria bacterium]|nr:methionine biosynthesis protein MetW [Deltaproteobacteria bacterium]HOM28498.1 methionine biosynthesis protein MetW [Deltaproteobacteria bacterium]HPP81719.1 methionine biosynthesis protein MetW [Deltaproteobacteria bacterium]